MTQINAYLIFDGQCREALTFYKECLDAQLELMLVSESPIAQQFPETMQKKVMHATLTKGTLLLMGSDMGCADNSAYAKGNDFSLSLNCSSEQEINRLYKVLTEGGEVLEALKVQFWGDWFAAFRDKFGIRWILNYAINKPQ
ncbi:VOC family protein [Mucilaginibacter sp. Bleaf8]|uniref:VOC family protein n=1 Tax=Mucilaginibacter sp. Bleaf8 TaxID=2834430 RepID=UPI001BD16AA9|nr:VOC family protein [Mucilaginibacter sp. Bleaf8]MBS7564478.1 VOC family protein [Mucilaginibacter sp. Bleaf8]